MLYTLLVNLWFAPLKPIRYVLLSINGDHKDVEPTKIVATLL